MVSRREFLARAARLTPLAGGALCLVPARRWLDARVPESVESPAVQGLARNAPVARFWTNPRLAGGNCAPCHPGATPTRPHTHKPTTVRCLLCAQGCTIEAGQRGRCRARANVNGELRSLVYGRPLAVHVDPIEKKPFFHFMPGSDAYSLGTSGCPLRCKFCQNWTLSQAAPEDNDTPYASVDTIVHAAVQSRAPVIAFTYNEPTVFAEYALDIAREAKKRRLRSVMVSCGFMTEAPLAEMCSLFDAIKIDLKGFSEEFYRKVSGAELKPVLRSIKQIRASGVHLEIVNLVVPTLNDDQRLVQELVGWISGELGPDVPLHFTRFHPDYQLLNLSPTPIATLERARDTALARGLHYVYVGNVPGHPGNHTYCPKCRAVVIRRDGFFVESTSLNAGTCAKCGMKIAGVFT